LNIDRSMDPVLLSPPSATLDVVRGKQKIDDELANSLRNLDLKERTKALDDLHGITPCPSEEDPTCVQEWLDTMSDQLNNTKHGTAFELAEKLDFSYVADSTRRLMFLRSSDCNPYEAAEKMICFFELKREVFGIKFLTKDIALEDLEEEDRDYIKRGSIQILPLSDMSGRDILIFHANRRQYHSMQSENRAKFYVFMESAKNFFQARTSGITVIYFGLDAAALESNKHSGLWWGIPNKITGIHLCTDSVDALVRDCSGITLFPPKILARTRLHLGSYSQCHSSLSAYGIPSQLLPKQCSDCPTMSNHLEWCKELEERAKKIAVIASPVLGYDEKDVLFGHRRNHTGNALMRKLVELQQETYNVVHKARKVSLAREIVKQIQKSGGRFLRRDDEGSWVEVSNGKARDKVAHTFRNLRRSR